MRSDGRRAGRVEAEAKLNLFLRIVGREPSGYHRLVTLFQRIALSDTVTVRTGGDDRSLEMDGPSQFAARENIAWKAAESFMTAAGWPTGFAIEIEKRIPIGGGLGGGSADAAAVLRILNTLAPTPLKDAAMQAIAFQLGADVPYLLSEHALALGTGRGEVLTPLAPLPSRAVDLWIPPFGVASKDAFGWYAAAWQANKAPSGRPTPALPSPLCWDAIAAAAVNDLEAPVFAHHPEMARWREQMEAAAPVIARMSGSGSTLFSVRDAQTPSPASAECRTTTTKTVERVASVEVIA